MKYEVWNKHPNGYTHKEKFKGDDIVIPANGFVLMDYEDAVQFRGQMFPMKKDAQGQQDPISFKVIHLTPHVESAAKTEAPAVVEFVCNRDGKKFLNQKDLDAHIAANYASEVFKDPVEDEKIAAMIKGKK